MTWIKASKYIIIAWTTLVIGQHKLMAQSYISVQLLNQPGLPIEWMKDHLSLNVEQMNAIGQLNLRYASRFDSIRQSQADRFVKFKKTYQMMATRDSELKYILNEDQFTLYQRKKKYVDTGSTP